MGLEENQTKTVVDYIETLARELCYVEALANDVSKSRESGKISRLS